ncbi:MAG TPA: PD-(D/E)XK nuclease family protein [Candidatus Acidoferrum sp.]
MIPPHSASSLQMIKRCPHQWAEHYLRKRVPYYESPEAKYGNRVHTALEVRLRDGTKLPADIEQHEKFVQPLVRYKPDVELKLGCNAAGQPVGFFDKGVYLRGKLDVVVHQDDQSCLFDWKTGKTYEDPFELRVHALLLRINRPQIKRIVGHYVWLKSGQLGRQHDLSGTAITWADIKMLHEKAQRMETEQNFPKVANVLCGWCRVHDCELNPENQNAGQHP